MKTNAKAANREIGLYTLGQTKTRNARERENQCTFEQEMALETKWLRKSQGGVYDGHRQQIKENKNHNTTLKAL